MNRWLGKVPQAGREEVDRLRKTVEHQATECTAMQHTIGCRVKSQLQRPVVLLSLFGAGIGVGLLNNRRRVNADLDSQKVVGSRTSPSLSSVVSAGLSGLALLRNVDRSLTAQAEQVYPAVDQDSTGQASASEVDAPVAGG